MISKAVIRDGGIFIPDISSLPVQEQNTEVWIQFEIKTVEQKQEIFDKAAGILKGKSIDPLKFQQGLRNEWQ